MPITGGTYMNQEIALYRENEKRINKIYLYLLCAVVLIGAALVVGVILFTKVKSNFTFWYVLYILGGGAVMISLPAYLTMYRPDSHITKYLLVSCNIGLVIFISIIMARFSENNFMNYFWAIVFSSLYFNKKTTIFAVTASALSYLAMVILIPDIRPVGFQSTEASVAIRIFYLGLAGSGCIVLTSLAMSLFERIMEQEQAKLETFHEVNSLLRNVAIGGTTLTGATQELRSYTESTQASIEKTYDVVESIGVDAGKIREGMDKARFLLDSLAGNADQHKDLSERTIQLTETIIEITSKGSDDVAEIGKEIYNVSSQFETTLNTIEELNRDSQHIGEIVQTVSNIAEQTKMLSMNAAIEAARAGDYGRGFAVVASKINKLSVQTQETLKQIEAIIKKFLPQLAMTVMHTKETAVVLEHGIENVNQINESFARISSTLMEGLPLLHDVSQFIQSQSQIVKDIDHEVSNARSFSLASESGMKNLGEVFNQFTEMVHNLSASTQELSSLAETLTMQARTRFSDAELQADYQEPSKTQAPQKTAEEIELDELIKSIDFSDIGTDDIDLEALERSLS
jgi:methyl-accepting chemotaxis protein